MGHTKQRQYMLMISHLSCSANKTNQIAVPSMELNSQVLRLSIMLAYFDTEQMFREVFWGSQGVGANTWRGFF